MGKKKNILLIASLLAVSVAACGKKGENAVIGAEGNTELAENEERSTGNMADGAGTDAKGENDAAAEGKQDGINGSEWVTHATEKGSIGVSLPQGWAYQVSEQENGDFSVNVHPQDEPEGVLSIQYMEFFGICGTGLVQEDCVVNGKEASKGIYDGHGYWDYIAFSGKYEGYVVENSAGESWWQTYQEQVAGILDSLSFGEEVKGAAEVVELEEGEPMEIGNSGKELCLAIQGADENMSICLSYGENEIEVAGFVEWLRECYVLRQEGAYFYVLVGVGFSNDAGGTYLLKVSEEGIEKCDYLDAVLREDVTQNYMETACKIDVLGSYLGIKHYGILGDKFYTDERVFEFFELAEGTLRKQLALIQDVEANLYGEKEILKKGTVIYPTGCDTEQKEFYFECEDPKYEGEVLQGFLEYEEKNEGFGYTVEGIDEYELFEELPYAG